MNQSIESTIQCGDYVEDLSDGEGMSNGVIDLYEANDPLITQYNRKGSSDYVDGIIDPNLHDDDLLIYIKAIINHQGMAGHHIMSMNSFYSRGIQQIVKSVYNIEGIIPNERPQTINDKQITQIGYKVEFTNVELTKPETTTISEGKTIVEPLTPNTARLKGLTYSAPMYVDVLITLTAYLFDGATESKTTTISNYRLASIPCQVGSDLCNLATASFEDKKLLEEDPLSPMGYFIIKGGEWAVDCLENIGNNMFHVFKNNHKNEVVRGTFISKPGDDYENSYQIIITYLTNQLININITVSRTEKIDIPFYILFRSLGITIDRDIVDHIVYGHQNDDDVTKAMLQILGNSFRADPGTKYKAIMHNNNQIQIIQHLADMIQGSTDNKYRKDDNVVKQLNINYLNIMDRYLLPHIGTGPDSRISKLRFVGYLINKLLRVYLNILPSTDRDSYENKRIAAAGTSIAKAFKTTFNHAVVLPIRKAIAKDLKSTPFASMNIEEMFKSAIDGSVLEDLLAQSITTGNKLIKIKRTEVTNRVSSQIFNHKNDMYIKAVLGTINTANSTTNNQNERADEMRRVQPSYPGYICIVQTAETGLKVGIGKQKACTAGICVSSSSSIVIDLLRKDEDVIIQENVLPSQITADKMSIVLVNGYAVGYTKTSYKLAEKYRLLRRKDILDKHVSIVWDITVRELRFYTDTGRMTRPLIVVYNNIVEYNDNHVHGDKSVQFNQWIRFTRAHINGLAMGKVSIDDLYKQGVIEYITPEESLNTLVCPELSLLRKDQHNVCLQYTHCDIPVALFGIVALASPLMDHCNPYRCSLFTAHRKQSLGWYALNAPYRIDKGTSFQWYGEYPLVSTIGDSLTYPNGQNCIVAIALYGGENCEDSIKVNKSSIDRGLFNASYFNYEKIELEPGEQFGCPDPANTMGNSMNGLNYEYIVDGFVKKGTVVKKGYILAIKCAKYDDPTSRFKYIDKSVVYKSDDPGVITKIIPPTRDERGKLFVKIQWRCTRPVIVGEKLCLTADHEVLTLDGWISINELGCTRKVWTLNPNTGCGEWQLPIMMYKFKETEDLIEIVNGGVSVKMTQNHRCWVSNDNAVGWKLTQVNTFYGDTCKFSVGANYQGRELTKVELDKVNDWARTFNTTGVIPLEVKRWHPAVINHLLITIGYENQANTGLEIAGIKHYNTIDLIQILAIMTGLYRPLYEMINGLYHITLAYDTTITIQGGDYRCGPSHCKVYCLTVPNHIFMIRRQGKCHWTGNSSRTGNKGLVGASVPASEMPYSSDGLVVDLVVNNNSIPTRMAINQLIETSIGMLAARKGSHIDATVFRKLNIDLIIEELKKYGIEYKGYKRMYNGQTGNPLDTLLFVGPTTYQRLQKFVKDETYAMVNGPRNPLTNQPVYGRQQGGGLRAGEMEKDVYCVHGCMRALYEKIYTDSDGTLIYICRSCGKKAVVNKEKSIYSCKRCGDYAEIQEVDSAWVSNLLFDECSAMNIQMKMLLAAHDFYHTSDKL